MEFLKPPENPNIPQSHQRLTFSPVPKNRPPYKRKVDRSPMSHNLILINIIINMNTTKKKQVTLHKNLKGPRSPQPVPKPISNKKKPQSKSISRGKKNSPSKDKPLKQLFATNPRNNKSPLLSKQNNTSKKSSSSSKSKSLTKTKVKS